ncbi:MAG: pilus assembly protein CpaF, partial [Sphingomonadales bacterium]|nr:pilus assembly protein CpaF [Sphingomonadales bacterium]
MFGKRSGSGQPQTALPTQPAPSSPAMPDAPPPVPVLSDAGLGWAGAEATRAPEPLPPVIVQDTRKSEEYYQTKSMIFGALIEAIDLAQLSRLDADAAREEIRDIVN